MKVSKDGQFLVVAGEAPYVLVIDLLSFNYQKIYGHNGPVTELKFLHNKAMFLSYGTNDKTLRINDLENFQSTELKVFNHRVTAMAVSNDDELLISANEMGQLHFWNLDNIGETIKVIDITEQPIHAISFNHGGDLLAIGNEDGVVFLADMENGVEGFKILSGLLGQESRVSEIVFSNNNELLATASYDGSVQMWIMDHLNKLPLTFKDHNDYVWSISFNPSGNYLLTGSRDGSLKVWPTRATLMSDKLCERLGRNLTRREWDRYVGEDIDFRNTCK
jgi:WD40 repeat protein